MSRSRGWRKRLFAKVTGETTRTGVRAEDIGPPSPCPSPSKMSAANTIFNHAIFALLKDAGEMLQNFPYLKAIAGITLTLLKIRDEVEAVGELTEELILAVEKRTVHVIQSLQEFPPDRLCHLHASLQEYYQLLESIKHDMQQRKESRLQRVILRAEVRQDIERYLRELKEFDGRFTVTTLTYMAIQLDKVAQRSPLWASTPTSEQHVIFQEALPPRPRVFIGRESELHHARSLVLDHPEPRLAILGSGGLGKTSLLATLLHDQTVSAAFPSRFFISCDQITSLIPLLNTIASVLQFDADQRNAYLQTNILAYLRSCEEPPLLCLDNFEDTWDPPASRHEIEAFLARLNDVPRLGVIITMRGEERPHSLSWTRPHLPPLQPLEETAAVALYENVSGVSDGRIPGLLQEVSYIPLAIVLLARQTELDGLDDVLRMWKIDGLDSLNRGDESDTRLTSVTASINLLLKSRRISGVPHIHAILGVLVTLPDGFPHSMIANLQARLPQCIDVARSFHALRRSGIVYLDAFKRYRLLAPIRQHVERTIPLDILCLEALRDTFLACVIGTGAEDHDTVVPELANIRHFVTSTGGLWDEKHIHACLGYLWWEDRVLWVRDITLASTALTHAHTPELQVRCRLRISEFMRFSSQYTEAESNVRPALLIAPEDPWWDAQVQMEMGEILRSQFRFEEAEPFLRQAVKRFKEVDDIRWECAALEKLGTLLRAWRRFSCAEEPLQRSLELAKRGGDRTEEGNALLELGKVYRLTNKMSEAEDALRSAISHFQETGALLNQANALRSTGDVQRGVGKLLEAEENYVCAQALYSRINNYHGEALTLRRLGHVYSGMRRRLDSAQQHFEQALVIYQRLATMDGQAFTHKDLGILLSRQGRHADAVTHLVLSVAFHWRRLHRSKWEAIPPICKKIRTAMNWETLWPSPVAPPF